MNNLIKKYQLILLLFLVLMIPLGDLLHSGLPITHDGQDHVARIANFYQNLTEGNSIPRWAPNLNWGYGHPILMFLYPLPSYFASLFHFFGFSLVDSIKIVFGLSFVLSGLTMFFWLRSFLSERAAFIGALLYTFAPYRFVDLYVRGAIGEHVAFIFPPLVLYFLFKLDSRLRGNDKRGVYWYFFGGTLSLAGLILAHNAISLMFLPIILFYALYLIWHSKQRKNLLFISCLLLLFGFLLSAFFWLPAFAEGKYTLRDIVTGKEALTRFVPWQTFIYGPWSYGITGQFTAQFGILQWLAVITSFPLVMFLFKKKNPLWVFVGFCLVAFIFIAFFMTEGARPLWEKITIVQKFQFPWRFLSLSVFFAAVLGAVGFSFLFERHSGQARMTKLENFVFILLIIAILFFNKDYWYAKDYLYKPVNFYTGIYNSTTDTGESAPKWSVRFMLKRPSAPMDVLAGKATIKEISRSATTHVYEINASEKTRLRENTLYFPGWKIFVDGQEVLIEFQDRANHGIMTFWVEKGKHTVQVQFEETKLRLLANLISIGSLLLLGFIGIWKGRKVWRN